MRTAPLEMSMKAKLLIRHTNAKLSANWVAKHLLAQFKFMSPVSMKNWVFERKQKMTDKITVKALKYTPTEVDIEITDISLLTIEEVEALPENIKQYGDYWWLRSPGYSSCRAAYVYYGGSVDGYGSGVGNSFFAVRPAITISNPTFEIGDIIEIQNKKYVSITQNKVLYNDKVIYHRFDTSTNDYDKSEIRAIVDGWLEGKKGEAEDEAN